MFFERISGFRHSLVFRLTLLYTTIFTISIFLALFIFYAVIISRINARTDRGLNDKMNEFSTLLVSRGIEAVKEHMNAEAEAIGTNKVFFRLLTTEGEQIVSSDLGPWKEIGISRIALKDLAREGSVFETLKLPGWEYKARVLCRIAEPGRIMQIGESLKEDDSLFRIFREIFRDVVVFVLALAAVSGWFMAKRSLSGVEKLTQTAMAIADGAMEKRVPLTGRGDEIDRLSRVFDHMLDRIQSLITEMKEVTDNIAHDIKSPITRIRLLSEVTLTTEKSVDEYQMLTACTVEECDRLLGMINTMLEISETKAGVSTLSLSEVDISPLIEEGCDLFRPLAEGKGLRVEMNTPTQCLLSGDKSKLQRVLSNLLDNAIKYTPPGGKITVSAEEVDKKVIISVQDTGIGISPEEIPRIFDRFFRADKSRSVPGAGLGLSLAQAIVRRHRGEIMVSSSPGSGSTFAVVLPRTKSS